MKNYSNDINEIKSSLHYFLGWDVRVLNSRKKSADPSVVGVSESCPLLQKHYKYMQIRILFFQTAIPSELDSNCIIFREGTLPTQHGSNESSAAHKFNIF